MISRDKITEIFCMSDDFMTDSSRQTVLHLSAASPNASIIATREFINVSVKYHDNVIMTEANITKKETLSCDQVSLVEIVGVEPDIAEKTKADAMKLIDNAWGM